MALEFQFPLLFSAMWDYEARKTAHFWNFHVANSSYVKKKFEWSIHRNQWHLCVHILELCSV